MKTNYIKFVLALFVCAVFNSCEETQDLIFSTPNGFAQLSSADDLVVLENAPEPVSIAILLDGPRSTDTTIELSISSDNPERFEILSGTTIVIEAGDTSGEVLLQPNDNFDSDGDAEVIIALSANSDLPVGIGGEGFTAAQRTVIIEDDDCPIRIEDWIGTYTVTEVFSAGGVNEGLTLANAFGESYQLEFALDPSDVTGTKVIVTNSTGFNQYVPNGTQVSFLTCTGVVLFDPLPLNLALFANLAIDSASYNEGNFSISVNGSLGNFGAYEFVWMKQ